MTILDVNNGLTLSELQTRVQALGHGSGVLTQITVALNAAQNRVCAIRRWSFLERQLQTTIPADTSEYGLDSLSLEMDRLDAVRLYDNDTEVDVTWIDPVAFRKRQWLFEESPSGPFYWTRYREAILFAPATDKAYELLVEGVVTPSALVNGTDRTVIPGEYGEVLVWGALEWLAIRERDWAMRQVAEEMFAKHLNALLTAYTHEQRQNSNEVARWDGWNEVGGGRVMWRA